MLTAAMVLGIVGGTSGIIAGLLPLAFGGIGATFGAPGSSALAWWGYAAIFLPLWA